MFAPSYGCVNSGFIFEWEVNLLMVNQYQNHDWKGSEEEQTVSVDELDGFLAFRNKLFCNNLSHEIIFDDNFNFLLRRTRTSIDVDEYFINKIIIIGHRNFLMLRFAEPEILEFFSKAYLYIYLQRSLNEYSHISSEQLSEFCWFETVYDLILLSRASNYS